jgi:hypothetical protein
MPRKYYVFIWFWFSFRTPTTLLFNAFLTTSFLQLQTELRGTKTKYYCLDLPPFGSCVWYLEEFLNKRLLILKGFFWSVVLVKLRSKFIWRYFHNFHSASVRKCKLRLVGERNDISRVYGSSIYLIFNVVLLDSVIKMLACNLFALLKVSRPIFLNSDSIKEALSIPGGKLFCLPYVSW